MASDHSFDVVSKLDMQEVKNAVEQISKEIGQRFDFRGSASKVGLEADVLVLHSDDEGKLKSVVKVVEERMVKRHISLKALDWQPVEPAANATVRQRVLFRQGVPSDKAKQIVKQIKGMKLKVQAAIQGDQVRVSGKKLDDLQQVMGELKKADMGLPLQFENFR